MTLKKSVLASVAAVSLTVVSAFASVPAQTSSCNYMFNTNLRLGAVSTDVQNLQKLLNMDAATKVASTGAGSMGNETLRFGPATMAAVKKFQAANGISPMSGYVGPLTRTALNTICTGNGNVSTPTTNTNGSGVSANAIPVSVLVSGQANAKLGEFVVSGNGIVTGIELMRTGLSNNSTLKNVYLYDGMTRLTGASSVLTDGTIRFNSSAGLFPVSGNKTITVRADIQCNNGGSCTSGVTTSGQTVGVAMKSVTMMGGTSTPVTGVTGPLFSISSASTATANFTTGTSSSSVSPQGTTINAGSMNQALWSNNLNVGVNKVRIHGATFKMIGSAPANTLSNVQLYVDGVSAGSASINANNQFVFNMSGNPLAMNTGSHLFELRGDIVGGANRNFYISLEEASDVMIEDQTLPGVFVTPTWQSTLTVTNMNGGTVIINNGSFTVNQDTTFNNTTTLVSGATNVKMAAWKFTAYGEDVKVTTVTITPTFSNGASTTLSNVGLYVNGGQVSSNQTTVTSGTPISFSSLGTNLLVPAGQAVTVEIRGDVVNSSNQAVVAGTIVFGLTSTVAQGYSSSQTAASQSANGQTLTIASSNATFAQTAGTGAVTRAPNQSQVKVGSFTIQAGSAEGITVNQIVVGNSGTMSNQLTNLTVKDGSSAIGTPIGNPTTSNTFSANVSIPMNTSKTFDVYADFGSSAAGQTVIPTMQVTYRGNTSNLTTTTSTVTGSTVTAGTAYIAATGVTFSSSLSPVAQPVVTQNNFAAGTFNFKVNNSVAGAVVKDVTFLSVGGTVQSITINGKTASFVNNMATIYDLGVTVPADAGGVNVPFTLSLVCVGTTNGCSATSGATVQVGISGMTYNNGSTVDQTIIAGASTTGATSTAFTLFASKPTYSVNATVTGGLVLTQINKIGEVTIAADANGNIKVNNIAFNIGSSNITGFGLSSAYLADGSTQISTSGIVSGCTAAGACVMTLGTTPNGYSIAAGQSKTFSLYATVAGTQTVNTSSYSVSSSVTAGTNTTWDDVVGGGTALSTATIYNFPTTSYVRTN